MVDKSSIPDTPEKEQAKDSGSWKVNFDNLLRSSELETKAANLAASASGKGTDTARVVEARKSPASEVTRTQVSTAKLGLQAADKPEQKSEQRVQRVSETEPAAPPAQASPWAARPRLAPGLVPEAPQPVAPAPKQPILPGAELPAPPSPVKQTPGGFAIPESPEARKPARDRTMPQVDPASQIKPDPRFPNHIDPRFQTSRPQPTPFQPERPAGQPGAALSRPNPSPFQPERPAGQPGAALSRPNPSPFSPVLPVSPIKPDAGTTTKPPGTTSGGERVEPWNEYIGTQPGRGARPGLPGLQRQVGEQPGINPTGQVINVSPEGRKAIDYALHNASNVQGHLLTGGVWGAALNTAKWGMDYKFAKGNVKWWGPYSPFQQKLEAEELRVQTAIEAHAAAEANQIFASQKLNPSTLKIQGIIDELDKKIITATLSTNPELNLLARQHSFLKDATNLIDATKIEGAIGTAEEVAKGSKLWVAGSSEANQLMQLARHLSGAEVAANPAALMSSTSSMVKQLETQLEKAARTPAALVPAGDGAIDLLKQQKAFLSDIGNLTNVNKAKAAIGSAEQVALSEPLAGAKKLFVAGSPEAQALLERAQQHVDFYKAKSGAAAAEARLGKLEMDLQALREAGAGNGWAAATKGFLSGTLVTGATISAGYAADKWLIGSNANMSGFDRFLIDGVAVPGVLLTPGIPTRYRVGSAIALFGLARAKGYFDDSGLPALSQSSLLLRPNTVDTLGFTTAALAPLGVRGKLAIAGATLVAGRGYNLLAHAAGWDGPDGIELRDRAVNALAADSNSKTTASFDRAVDAGLALSRHKAGEGALDLQLADLINSGNRMSKLDYLRNHAILSTAIGMARLEKGSRIVEGGSNAVDIYGDDSRILKKYKYDFLGESMLQLAQGFSDLSDLRYALHQEKAKVNTDGSLNDSAKKEKLSLLDDQMNQCDSERQKIDKTLKEIFGAHDIDGIFKELVDACRTRSRDMDQIIFKRKALFETLTAAVNPEIRAKFARDLALAHLAEATRFGQGNDGEQARIMYSAALDFLSKANSLDPKNPNLPKLQSIANSISAQIPNAMKTQYSDSFSNPFQIKK